MLTYRDALDTQQVDTLRSLWDDDHAIRGGRVRVRGRDVAPPRSHRDCLVVPTATPDWLADTLDRTLAATLSLIRYRPGHHIAWHTDALDTRRSNIIIGLSHNYAGERWVAVTWEVH